MTVNESNALSRGRSDSGQIAAMRSIVTHDSVVFDVGANVGAFTVMFADMASPKGRVFAFEPVPDTYHSFEPILNSNQCQNVETLPIAICDTTLWSYDESLQ